MSIVPFRLGSSAPIPALLVAALPWVAALGYVAGHELWADLAARGDRLEPVWVAPDPQDAARRFAVLALRAYRGRLSRKG